MKFDLIKKHKNGCQCDECKRVENNQKIVAGIATVILILFAIFAAKYKGMI